MSVIKSVRIQLNQQGIRDLLKSQAVADSLEERGTRIAAAAGEGFEVTTTTNKDRVVTFVKTSTNEGRRAEGEHRALSRAIDAGR